MDLVRRFVDPPSAHGMPKVPRSIFQTPQAKAVDKLYNGQVSNGMSFSYARNQVL